MGQEGGEKWPAAADLLTDAPQVRQAARHYAELFALLRERGTPIPSNDHWIAALARQHRMPLLSFDVHFATVPGIQAPGFL